MKKTVLGVLCSAVLGCGGQVLEEQSAARGDRNRNPNTTAAELAELTAGNRAFAYDIYRQLAGANEGNFFYSPHSISTALGMTYAGARGETASQMKTTLHYRLPQDRLHVAFNKLDLELKSRGQGAQGQDDKGFRLNVANALWTQAGFPFEPTFVSTVDENYEAGLNQLDFQMDPEAARGTINGWVEDKTEDKIKNLIPQGAITPDTRFVLTNAVYFNAAWNVPFAKQGTRDADFHTPSGTVSVPTMHGAFDAAHVATDSYEALAIPYDAVSSRHELDMVIIMPKLADVEPFQATLDANIVDNILASLRNASVSVSMPKFKFESSFKLGKTLKDMGMPIAFSNFANFSGISQEPLLISDVIHKGFISVNEAGTEAAAATAVIGRTTTSTGPRPRIPVVIDRPFLFLIRDYQTGAVLFVGRVINPAA